MRVVPLNFAKEHKDMLHLKPGQKTECLDLLLAILRCHYHILEVIFHSGYKEILRKRSWK